MKKKPFKELKPGQKFRFQRKLYLKDDADYPIQISNGKVMFQSIWDDMNFDFNTLITPVKIKITIL